MNNELTVDKQTLGSLLAVRLEGSLNESLVPETISALGDGRAIVFDVANVARITSYGVRQWIRGLAVLRERTPRMFLENCSYAWVSQLNMIQGFAEKVVVVSVLAPMVCTGCEAESKTPVDVRNGPPADLTERCKKCGAALELEEDPASYFHFAKAHRLDPADAMAVGLLREIDTARGRQPSAAAAPASAVHAAATVVVAVPSLVATPAPAPVAAPAPVPAAAPAPVAAAPAAPAPAVVAAAPAAPAPAAAAPSPVVAQAVKTYATHTDDVPASVRDSVRRGSDSSRHRSEPPAAHRSEAPVGLVDIPTGEVLPPALRVVPVEPQAAAGAPATLGDVPQAQLDHIAAQIARAVTRELDAGRHALTAAVAITALVALAMGVALGMVISNFF